MALIEVKFTYRYGLMKFELMLLLFASGAWKKKTQGIKVMRIVGLVGLSYPTVRDVIGLFAEGSWAAIRPASRGREPGQGRLPSDEQGRLIKRAIIDNRPEQLKLDFYLWGRSAVALLIEQECSLKLSVRTVGKYLKRWGFTPQKPIKKAYGQRPGAVQAWLDGHYPAIVAKAKSEGGEIHWGDGATLTNTDARAPAGKTPVGYAPAGKREKLSMIAAVTNQGKARWRIIDGAFNADKLVEFLDALIKGTHKKVFLILDNQRIHHSKPIKAW